MAVLNGERPNFLPRIPILMQFAAEYIGSNYGAFASDHRVLVDANIRCAEDFGIDQLSAISDPYRETSGFGAEIRFHVNAVPECVRPPLADSDDLDRLIIPDPLKAVRMRDRIDAIQLYVERDSDQHSILGWVEGPGALAADLRGLSDFYMDLLEEPDWCVELMDICTETSIRFAKAQIIAGADTVGIGDAMCSQVSGSIYNSLIWPRQLKLVKAIQEAGAKVRLHICGQTGHLMSGIAKLGVDILDCDHMVDMRAARNLVGPNVVIAGNIDPVSGLRFGNPAKIREQVQRGTMEAGFPHMICAGCEVPAGTPEANLRALLNPIQQER